MNQIHTILGTAQKMAVYNNKKPHQLLNYLTDMKLIKSLTIKQHSIRLSNLHWIFFVLFEKIQKVVLTSKLAFCLCDTDILSWSSHVRFSQITAWTSMSSMSLGKIFSNIVEHWAILLRDEVEYPTLDVFRTLLDKDKVDLNY